MVVLILDTDKSSYQIGEIQKLGLNVTNPSPAQKVGIKIWLEMPRDTFTLVNSSYSLPAGLNYIKFKTFKIPKLPLGNYIWHAVLSDPKTNEIIKEDTAVMKLKNIIKSISILH